MTIGYDEIEAALDELLARLGELGEPGSPVAVEEWMRGQGIDPHGVLEAVAYAIHPIPHEHHTEAATAWTQGFTIGWMLARRQGA